MLGATGSIGKNTLAVLRHYPDDFEAVLLTSNTNRDGVLALGCEFPRAAVLAAGIDGKEAVLTAIADCGADICVNGIAGAAGLEPSVAALDAGMDLALANKETIVMAGPLVLKRAAQKNVNILPVDSEHSAIFHLLRGYGGAEVQELILTASGGPLRTYTKEQLARVSVQEALAHPTWKMGTKISLDSATLANKGLEVIEAAHLFNTSADRIKVLIHPQSIVHSMIRLRNNAVYAQASKPDMRLPIQEALFWPNTTVSPFAALDFSGVTLAFTAPDSERFPMLPLAYQAAKAGGIYPLVYNAANEIAAAAFLQNKIRFFDIPRLVSNVLTLEWNRSNIEEDLQAILHYDTIARARAKELLQ
ncbi:1-deoxy-D-xylulose 5-phosphate reductoisomerase [Spirochaetia bacterium]|nr:1-deoxy-D-xylulose 5-phosphate reductoisomerase [Spirochaetia bacterium]